MEKYSMIPVILIIFFLLFTQVAIAIYLTSLASRLVKAVEKIADKLESREGMSENEDKG